MAGTPFYYYQQVIIIFVNWLSPEKYMLLFRVSFGLFNMGGAKAKVASWLILELDIHRSKLTTNPCKGIEYQHQRTKYHHKFELFYMKASIMNSNSHTPTLSLKDCINTKYKWSLLGTILHLSSTNVRTILVKSDITVSQLIFVTSI